MTDGDEALVRLAQSGDRRAFEQLLARIRQLGGRMASFDRQRRQSAQDGSTTASAAVARVEQRPTRVALTIYNLANIAPRQTTQLTLAAVDVEKAVETIRAQAMRAGGRIVTGTINRDRPSQTSGVLDIEVPDAAAAALIQSVRAFGEVMRSGADTASDTVNTTTAKQGIRLNLVSIAALAPRQTITINATAADLAGGYRKVLGFLKDERISARLLNTQFSQQGGGAASGVLEFELNRAHEPALWEAVKSALAVLSQSTAQADAAADAIDSKVRVRMLLMDQRLVPPRQTSSVGLEVADVEKAAGVVQAAAAGYGGRTIDWQFSRQRGGMNTGRLVVEVPAAQAQAMLKQVADAGTVRTIESSRNEQVPEGAAARLRLQIELSNAETLVGRDEGLIASLRDGLATSIRGLLWSVQLIIIGLLVVGPWALLGWVGVKLWKRSRRRQAAA